MLPLAQLALGTVVALSVVALAGCGTAAGPTPTPTESASATPTATTPVVVDPTTPPTTVSALPGTAFLRVSATAEVGDREVRLELTFARAQGAASSPADLQAVQDECPNAITSQLEIYPELEPTGVITSQLVTTGDWPEGMAVAVAAGGTIASFGEGAEVAPTQDGVGMFGCTVPVITGPGSAEFISLLLGDPAIPDRTDLEAQVAQGYFGFETDADSAVDIRWRDCVIQLSSAAQRTATASSWVQQTQGDFGCLIGDQGSV
jgi:hypothetical protein